VANVAPLGRTVYEPKWAQIRPQPAFFRQSAV